MCLTSLSPLGSSPHTRGAPPDGSSQLWRGRIIPAYAGSTSTATGPAPRGRDHPRIRGEHANQVAQTKFGKGSSPHTRGAPTCTGGGTDPDRIIPAYAGSTRSDALLTKGARDHPRIRGEHNRILVPRVREIRIIPAYAGSTAGGSPTP